MACPLFLPSERLGATRYFEGRCAADPLLAIPVDTLKNCCNPGYARDTCERAAQAEADAFRFLVKSRSYGTAEVAWTAERDHHPVAVGILSLAEPGGANAQPLECQARVCAAHV